MQSPVTTVTDLPSEGSLQNEACWRKLFSSSHPLQPAFWLPLPLFELFLPTKKGDINFRRIENLQ